MWQCPNCGRSFKNTGQHHFCGKLSTIDEYITRQHKRVQPLLRQLRECIRAAAPDAVEKISWRMPTFWQGENLIHFAAFKKHIGLYPGDMSNSPFAARLADYHTAKGTIHLPLDKPPDLELIADITRWRVQRAWKNTAKHHNRVVRQPTGLSNTSNDLIANLDKLHTTELGEERIKRNLGIGTEDCVTWCVRNIKQAEEITRKGKNWYARRGNCVITVNAGSYTIITAQLTKTTKAGR